MQVVRRLSDETLNQIVEYSSQSVLVRLSRTERVLGELAERRLYGELTFITNAARHQEFLSSFRDPLGCLRLPERFYRSLAMQSALVTCPRRLAYVRNLVLDGSYHGSRLNGGGPGLAALDDVISPGHLRSMISLRNIECTGLRLDFVFLQAISKAEHESLKIIAFTRCSLLNSETTGVATAPNAKTNWTCFPPEGWKDIHLGHSAHISCLNDAFHFPNGLYITNLTISWPNADKRFSAMLSTLLSTCQTITSVTITPHHKTKFDLRLPQGAIPQLRAFSGTYVLAKKFLTGRPVDTVDLKFCDAGVVLDATTLELLLLSTVEIQELRLHCDISICCPYRQPRWMTMLHSIPDITPRLRKLCLGTVALTMVSLNPIAQCPENLATTILSRLAELVEVHFDRSRVCENPGLMLYTGPYPSRELSVARIHDGVLRLIMFGGRRACKRRDEILDVCEAQCPSLRRIVLGEGRGSGGFEKLGEGKWSPFTWEERRWLGEIKPVNSPPLLAPGTYDAEFIKIVI